LIFKVGNSRVLRLEPHATSPNVIAGYQGNTAASGVYGASIGGGGTSGMVNYVSDSYGTVSGGRVNVAGDLLGTTEDAMYATVGGGVNNAASGLYGSIGGGNGNRASNEATTVAGGQANTASGIYSVVGGGASNTASGNFTSVPGGNSNIAQGNASFAAGSHAYAQHQGAFVWADSNTPPFSSIVTDEFSARATGGVRFVSAVDGSGTPTAGVTLAAGGGSWSSLSDKNLKDNITAVDSKDILEAITALPISTWNYKAQDGSIRHIGPMAQDFYTAFGVGEDNTHITSVDADGVALAGIQALAERVSALEKGSGSTHVPGSPWIFATVLLAGIVIGQALPRRSRKAPVLPGSSMQP
jgi:hypothetical protein